MNQTGKKEFKTIAEKNRVVDRIFEEILARDSFLLLGHKNPDEDCIASLVAFALVLGKFLKSVSVSTCGKVQEQLQYLLNVCTYNSIKVVEGCEEPPKNVSCIVILDTPKASMIDVNESIQKLLDDPKIRKIEIDHHLSADAEYCGDDGYCLVSNASSTCELIGYFGYKIMKHKSVLEKYGIEDIFSRNLALALLTGIIGDSKMGKFLKTKREKWFYNAFSSMLSKMLSQLTLKDSTNFSSMEEIFKAIESLSTEENECFDRVMERKRIGGHIGYAVFPREESVELVKRYGNDIIVTVTKAAADKLSEESGRLGLVVYYDVPEISDFIQFRLRRNRSYMDLDLRSVLEKFNITNGGGHPGAVGFRILKNEVNDLPTYVERLVEGIAGMMSP